MGRGLARSDERGSRNGAVTDRHGKGNEVNLRVREHGPQGGITVSGRFSAASLRGACFALLLIPLLLPACTVGPDYRRPHVDLPGGYRGAPAGAPAPSVGDLAWWELFGDPTLQTLIREALAANHDLQIAVTRILQAQAQVTIARSQLWPTVNALADAPYERFTGGNKPPFPRESFEPAGGATVSWELDLWGRLRRATEAARADLLATEEARRGVVTTLIAEVAQAYFDLRSLDAVLDLSRQTLATRRQSLELIQARYEHGLSNEMDVRQAEALVQEVARTVPDVERRIERTENAINLLLAKHPGPVPRGRPLVEQVTIPAPPPGLPSDLLARRPDLRQAEAQMVSANAQIGAVKAQLFPTVMITGFAGVGGAVVGGQSFGPFGIFQALPTITIPIFNAGRLVAQVDLAEARTREAVIRYQQAIQGAVREVADALVEVRKREEFRQEQVKLVAALKGASTLAGTRYSGGVTSYLEVLDTETRRFSAEVTLVEAQLGNAGAVIQLYRALGGGWLSEEVAPPPTRAAAQ
jgi:multidrug efflux system outer membrane protein